MAKDAPTPPWDVHFSRRVAESIVHLGITALRFGLWKKFDQSMKGIDRRLKKDPLVWGDPNYRLPNLGLLMCHGISEMLHCYFAVSEERKTIYVKSIHFLPDALTQNR